MGHQLPRKALVWLGFWCDGPGALGGSRRHRTTAFSRAFRRSGGIDRRRLLFFTQILWGKFS
jgi:hypothetical protein